MIPTVAGMCKVIDEDVTDTHVSVRVMLDK